MGESTGGGGNESDNEPRGTTFGVDGVSKTGSTSKDQQIGFTDGQGGKGANFDALQGATSQQTTAAVAAADAARDAGASQTAAQAAVSNILESYDPSAVNRQGNLTDSGQGLVSRAVQEAIEDTAEFDRIQRDQQAANIMGIMTDAPPARTPADFDSQLLDFLDEGVTQPLDVTQPAGTGFADAETARIANLTPDQAAAENITVSRQRAAQAAMQGRTVNPVTGALQGPDLIDIFSEANLDPAAGQEAQRQRNVEEQLRRDMALSEINRNLGITATPQSATAASVLGTSPADAGITSLGTTAPASDFLVGQQSSVARPGLVGTAVDGTPITTNEFQSVYVDGRGMSVPRPQMSVINTAAADPMTQLSQEQAIFGLGDNAPQSVFEGLGSNLGLGQRELSPLEQSIQAAVNASTRTPTQQAGVTPTGPMGAQAAAGTPAENFYADAYRDFRGTPDQPFEGNIPGQTLAGISGGVTNLFGGDAPSAQDTAAFQSGQLLSLGGTMDPETGAISGAKAGRGTLNMNRFRMVTYSGMPDPNYDGPFANLVNPPQDTGGGGQEQMKAPNDPCPAGYQLVDGVCQPVDQAPDPSPPGSDFVINPTTGLPTLFTPATQATQVGQINPFVLQPYAPQQIAAPTQGIQGLSPTGAALGRQV